ncbi:uncharacterized protein M6B38_145130 [Iris pallida]|uniref:Uncharacterized protein n=1 Tax=Iris pallida TaxID=29817 RepID=A0AAX6F999_IRIPA|nr:uncharacterized protein M6B38_145130 [Iris pallida]
MEASFVPRSNHGTTDDEEEDELGSMSSFSNDDDDDDEEEGELGGGSRSPVGSSSSDSTEDSSSSSPLFEMSSLMSQLPFKRGLSVHFEGKSQSFTSLSSVKSLEDLVKPERPFRRTNPVLIKSSKSYGWGLATTTTTSSHNKKLSPRGSSRTITKKNYSTGTSKRTTGSSFLGTWKQ